MHQAASVRVMCELCSDCVGSLLRHCAGQKHSADGDADRRTTELSIRSLNARTYKCAAAGMLQVSVSIWKIKPRRRSAILRSILMKTKIFTFCSSPLRYGINGRIDALIASAHFLLCFSFTHTLACSVCSLLKLIDAFACISRRCKWLDASLSPSLSLCAKRCFRLQLSANWLKSLILRFRTSLNTERDSNIFAWVWWDEKCIQNMWQPCKCVVRALHRVEHFDAFVLIIADVSTVTA